MILTLVGLLLGHVQEYWACVEVNGMDVYRSIGKCTEVLGHVQQYWSMCRKFWGVCSKIGHRSVSSTITSSLSRLVGHLW